MRCEACVGFRGVIAGNRRIAGITIITVITADIAAEFYCSNDWDTAMNDAWCPQLIMLMYAASSLAQIKRGINILINFLLVLLKTRLGAKPSSCIPKCYYAQIRSRYLKLDTLLCRLNMMRSYKEQPEVTGSHIINYKLKARIYANILGALLSWVMDLTHLTPSLINLLQRPITTSFKFVLFPSQFWGIFKEVSSI